MMILTVFNHQTWSHHLNNGQTVHYWNGSVVIQIPTVHASREKQPPEKVFLYNKFYDTFVLQIIVTIVIMSS